MQTAEIPIYNIDLFGAGIKHFWMRELSGLLEKFPALEFPHKQDFYTLIFIDEADGEITLDNYKTRLNNDKIIIIRPHCISSIDINRKAKGKIICFTDNFFSLRYNNNVLYQFSFLKRDTKPYIRLTDEQKSRWSILINLTSEEYHLNKKETPNILRSYLNILLFELERVYNPTGFVKIKTLKHEKIQEFEHLIDKYFETKKLPSDYAEMLNISPNYLNKICKEETGHTAGEFIRKRITIEAQRLLHYTNHSIKEIADKLGFEDTSYFVTFFKKQTGITPEQFRKNVD